MTENKNILAIDTSSDKLILGLSFGGDRLVKSEEKTEQSHGQLILKKIGELCQSANLDKKDITNIVVCRGPGSFTGLRIGIAAAKGLATALDIKIISVNLFELAAYRLKEIDKTVEIIIPLKKDQFFIAPVKQGKSDIEQIKVISAKEIHNFENRPIAAYQIALENYLDVKSLDDYSSKIVYDASDILYLGDMKINNNQFEDLNLLEPLYIQKSQAEINYDLLNKK